MRPQRIASVASAITWLHGTYGLGWLAEDGVGEGTGSSGGGGSGSVSGGGGNVRDNHSHDKFDNTGRHRKYLCDSHTVDIEFDTPDPKVEVVTTSQVEEVRLLT